MIFGYERHLELTHGSFWHQGEREERERSRDLKVWWPLLGGTKERQVAR